MHSDKVERSKPALLIMLNLTKRPELGNHQREPELQGLSKAPPFESLVPTSNSRSYWTSSC